MRYINWLRGGCNCDCNNSCSDVNPCDCDNILLEISNLHTDDQVLQDEIDYVSGVVETISGGCDCDLDDYYTKEEIDSAIETIENEIPSLDGYATEDWVENKNYLTEHQPLKTINGNVISGTGNIVIETSGTSITIDDHLDSTSTNPVQNKVIVGALNDKLDASAYTPTVQVQSDWNVTDSASTAYIKNKPEIPSLSGYATEQWVLDKNYITGVDLSDYALKSEIPTVPTSNSAFTNDMHYVTSAETANYVTSGNVETQITNRFWCGTMDAYNQISVKDPEVLYLIHE